MDVDGLEASGDRSFYMGARGAASIAATRPERAPPSRRSLRQGAARYAMRSPRYVPNHSVLPTCTAVVAPPNSGSPSSFTTGVTFIVRGSRRAVAQPWGALGPAEGLMNWPVTKILPSGAHRRLSGWKSTFTLERWPPPASGTR